MKEVIVPKDCFLYDELYEIKSHVAKRDCLHSKVSKVSVGWHLDHMLKVINKSCGVLQASNPNEFKSNFSFIRFLIFLTGHIPRGVARAPRSVMPPEVITPENLYLQLEEAVSNLEDLERLPPKSHFKHPYFKIIDKQQSIRFLKIHTKHHLKIIRDILKKSSKA